MTKVSKANMEQGKILWVDDEIASFKPHVMVLEGKGYHVTTASSGAEAIELMDGQPFDCILLDEHMPGQTGLERPLQITCLSPSSQGKSWRH